MDVHEHYIESVLVMDTLYLVLKSSSRPHPRARCPTRLRHYQLSQCNAQQDRRLWAQE